METGHLTLKEKVEVWRQKQREGGLSPDESKEAIAALRGDRQASYSAPGSKAKKVEPVVNFDDI